MLDQAPGSVKVERQPRRRDSSSTHHHFDASRVLTPIVRFVAETLVPLMVVAPGNHVLLPSETATAAGLLAGGGAVELRDASLLQPTIIMAADMTATIVASFIKDTAAWREAGTRSLRTDAIRLVRERDVWPCAGQ